MLMSYKKTLVMSSDVQASCSPEGNNRSPHSAAFTNHPVGGRYLAKLMKGNPWWDEEGRRDSWRWRKASTMWERLAPVGKLLSVKCVKPLDRTNFLSRTTLILHFSST